MTTYKILVTAADPIILETFRYWLLSFFHNQISIETHCLHADTLFNPKKDSYALCMSLCFSPVECRQTAYALVRIFPVVCTCNVIVMVSQNGIDSNLPKVLCNTPVIRASIATCMEHVTKVLDGCYRFDEGKEQPVVMEEDAPSLTPRELEVLTHIAMGETTKEISFALGISHHTVVSHKRNLYLKTGARTLQQLALYAVMHLHTPYGS